MTEYIILLGGTAGTGKTRLAREMSTHLNLDHRLGTGFVREIVRYETSVELEPDLFSFTFRASNPILNLQRQAERLFQAIQSCITRARNEGTSLVIEGSHLIPSLYARVSVDAYIVLAAPDSATHLSRLRGKSHPRRDISTNDLVNARLIDEYYRGEATKFGLPYVFYDRNLEEILEMVIGDPFEPSHH